MNKGIEFKNYKNNKARKQEFEKFPRNNLSLNLNFLKIWRKQKGKTINYAFYSEIDDLCSKAIEKF